jgi:hypothetical protein
MQRVCESSAEQAHKLIDRLLARNRWHLLVFLDIAQGQAQQLAGRFVAREIAAILDDVVSCICMLSMALVTGMISIDATVFPPQQK